MTGMVNANESPASWLSVLGIDEKHINEKIRLLIKTNSRYLRDLRTNVTNALQAVTLVKKEAFLLAFGAAVNEKHTILQKAFETLSRSEGATDEEIAEVGSCTSLVNANNVYYRFTETLSNEYYDSAPSGIRTNILSNTILGKEFSELLSLVISALNGCQMCLRNHERVLTGHGTNKQRILDAVRVGSVIRSLAVITV